MSRLRRRYGAGPVQAVAVLGTLALAGYAVSRVIGQLPVAVWIAIWFVGAAVAWDLVLGPLLALADNGLRAVLRGRPAAVNAVRVPALISGALLLVSAPLVLHRSPGVYGAKTGLDQSVFLGRWLAVTAVLFAGSAVLYALRSARARRSVRAAGSAPPARRRG